MTARANTNQAILDGTLRLRICDCSTVVIEAKDGMILDADVLDEPTVGMVALNAETGRALVVTEALLPDALRWFEKGRATFHHPHDCGRGSRGVRTAGRGGA